MNINKYIEITNIINYRGLNNISSSSISIEKKIKTLLTSIGVAATVKSDRYSLPYVKEIKHTGMGESYLNGAFEIEPFLRTIAKEILNEDLYKIRFYVLAEIEDRFPMASSSATCACR